MALVLGLVLQFAVIGTAAADHVTGDAAYGSGTISGSWGGHCPEGSTPSFAFDATSAHDGASATGTFSFTCSATASWPSRTWSGSVSCLAVAAPEAILGGTVTSSDNPAIPAGTDMSFAVKDGGAAGAGDAFSVIRAGADCPDETPFYALASGDIVVEDASAPATETCNGLDDDGNGLVDDGVGTTYYRDADGDGYGHAASSTTACSQPAGYVEDSSDCDDTRATVYPGAVEKHDGLDNDCDGLIDEDPYAIAVFGNNYLDDLIAASGFSVTAVSNAQLETPGFLASFDAVLYTRDGTSCITPMSVAASSQVASFVGSSGRAVLLNGDYADAADPFLGNDAEIRELVVNAVEWAAASGRGYVGELPGAAAGLTSNANSIPALGFVAGSAGHVCNQEATGNVTPTSVGTGHPVLSGVDLPRDPVELEFGPTVTGVDAALVLATYPDGNPAIIARGDFNAAPTVTVTGVVDGATYEYSTVPSAGCEVTDPEDGSSAFSAALGAISGPRAADGLGTRTATCTYTDSGGTTVTATATFTIVDTTPPALVVSDDLTVEATSAAGAVVDYAAATATDGVDGIVAATCDPAAGTQFPLGSTTVTCHATDLEGNTTSQTFTVTVQDTTPPDLALPANVTITATSAAGATHDYTASATDLVDGSLPATCSPPSGSTFPLGTTTVACEAVDAESNRATGSFTVTVQDHTAPVVTVPGPITLEATGPAGAVATFDVSATDEVDGSIVPTCVPASGSTFALGSHTVSCDAQDSAGNTGIGTISVTVVDTTPPQLELPAPLVVEATSNLGATVTFTATASDIVDGAEPVFCDRASGETFGLGTVTVTCTATDAAGNARTGYFTVTVQDTTAPTLALPDDLTAEATDATGATVTYPAAAAEDVVDGPLAPTCTPTSGAAFPLGVTQVNCAVTDAAGNSASGTFLVTVVDTTAPQLLLPPNQLVAATGPEGATVDYPPAGALDAVSGALTPLCSPAAGTTFALGTTTVTCSVSDAAGNEATGSFTVTVQDQTAPIVTVPPDTTVEATSFLGTPVTFASSVTAHDNVDGPLGATCAPPSGSTFALGGTAVDCSAQDVAGNVGSNSFTVTVVDTTGPEITVPANISVTATSSSGSVVAYPEASAADIVDGNVPVACVAPSGGTFPLGTSTVACTATDAAGNTSTKSFTVTVAYETSDLQGFTTPDGSVPVFKINRTVSVRFELLGDSAGVTDAVAKLYLAQISDGVAGEEVEADATGAADGGNTFRYDPESGQYVFNLGTKGLSPGTWQARLDLGDGVTRTALFALRK